MSEAVERPADVVAATDATLWGWYGASLALVAILLATPIWSVAHPPLVDYPNNLARAYILYAYDDVPSFQATYESNLLSTPSVAMDVFLLLAQPFCDVRTAGKIFLTLTLWLWLAGWHLLGHAVHGRPTWMALGGGLFAYHSMFFYGFNNFSFGLGVFLVALAAWLHGRNHWPWPRHLLIAGLALACYFCHMSAFIFLAGSALAITAWEAVRGRRLTVRCVLELLPVLVPLAFFFRGGGQKGFAWNTLQGKFIGALSLFRGYDTIVDALFLVDLGLLLILLFSWAVRRSCVGSILFAGLGCVAMFLISPYEIFGGMPADARFLLAASALVALSFDWSLPRRKAVFLLAFFGALVVFRIGAIGVAWNTIDRDLREQLSLMEFLPEEARVYPIVKISEAPQRQKWEVPAFHAPCYAVIEKKAYVPLILAIPGHTPILYKSPPVTFHRRADHFAALADVPWERVFAEYEFVWCCREPDDYRRFLETRCERVAERGAASLWRVRKAD